MEGHLAAARRERSSSAQENEAYGQTQERDFLSVLGADAEVQISEANAILGKLRGKMDLKAISRSNGAVVAMQLLHIAQARKASGRA